MWKKGELVWVTLISSDTWIPGQILDPSEPFGSLVSFFGLMEPRYVPKPCLRSFERDFGTLVSDSWRYRRFVNRALQAHFWNISFGLWCSCQPPIDSPYFDRESSLLWFPPSSKSALGFVRGMAVSLRVPLRRLAETNSSTAQILSFRRYTVDFNRSESIYEEIRESARLIDLSEEQDWCLDPSEKMDCIDPVSMFSDAEMENSRDLSLGDPLPKDTPCCSSSPSSEQHVDKPVQICTWNTRNRLTNSGSSVMKACVTMARTPDHENACHSSKNRELCQVEKTICLLNSESSIEDIIEEDVTSVAAPRAAVSEAPPDVMIESNDGIIGSDDGTVTSSAKQLSPLLGASNEKAFLAKPISFVVLKACKNQACSVKETYDNPRSKLDSSMITAKTLDDESSDRNTFNRTQDDCSDDALKEVGQGSLHITETSNKEFSYDDVGVVPAEPLQDLEAATAVGNQTRVVDDVKSTGVKRKGSRDRASARNSKRKKKAGKQPTSNDKPLNLHLMKDMRLADPKCLRMKFLSRHGNLPSKSELLKRFSVFGKIDASRTDVNPGESSAKIVFLQSIDAVTAYQFARSKKFKLGRSKVMYRLDAIEENSEMNKVSVTQKPQNSDPSPRSSLKKHGSVDNEEGRSNLKKT
ncbi:unnamed protein product [Thlaspi arvense]|uniref:RRM domain-containing protein n=1 Tax=Thlaspi arvense TaxID=13288 RepID=A0AAU9RB33_THLAR|nr:unnamed protein product [Thlaspi arvense]